MSKNGGALREEQFYCVDIQEDSSKIEGVEIEIEQ